jgi:hypothetical protein
MVSIRYLNDKRPDIHSSKAVVHVLPGKTKLTLVHFKSDVVGGHPIAIHVEQTMYSVEVELKPGYSYAAWPGGRPDQAPRVACVLEYRQEDFEKLQRRDANGALVLDNSPSSKAGCSGPIDAKEYVRLHGSP